MSEGNTSRNGSRDGGDDEMVSITLQVSAYCVIMVVALLGNLLVIITYKEAQNELKKQVMGATICHMAVADLITTVVGIPYMITRLLYNQWLISGEFGVAVCKLQSFAIEVGFAVSALSIAIIAVERFLSVFHPLKKILNVRSAHVISALVWLSTCCFYAPKLYTTNVYTRGYKMSCNSKASKIKPWSEIEASIYSILFLMTLILYIAIVVKVTCKKSIPGQAITNTSKAARNRINRRVIRQGLGVITIHYLCWLPYLWIYITCVVFKLKIINVCQNLGMFHHFGIFFLGYSNAALNPVLYTATNESFRKGCKNVIRATCGSRITPTLNRSSSRNSTKREKSRQNGDMQNTENAVQTLSLNCPVSRRDSPRVIMVSSS